MTRARGIALVSGLLLGGLLISLAVRRMDLARLAAELKGIDLPWLLATLVAYVSVLPLWAAQWRVLAPAVAGNTYWNMLGVIAISSTLLNTTAMLLGEAGAVVLLVARVGLSRSAAISVLAMDQLLVGIAKLAVIGVAYATIALPLAIMRASVSLLVGVVLLLGVCIAMSMQSDWLADRLAPAISTRVVHAIRAFAVALAPLQSFNRSTIALLLALAKKSAEILAIMGVQRAFGVSPSASSAVLVLAATSLSTLLPLVPGNIGTYEAAIVLVYRSLGIPLEQAAGMALVQHACYFTALALPGVAWLGRSSPARNSAVAS